MDLSETIVIKRDFGLEGDDYTQTGLLDLSETIILKRD